MYVLLTSPCTLSPFSNRRRIDSRRTSVIAERSRACLGMHSILSRCTEFAIFAPLLLIDTCDMCEFEFQRNHRRAERDAIRAHLPHIDAELDKSMQVLSDLELRLPVIRSQVAHIQRVYDSGRRKVSVAPPPYPLICLMLHPHLVNP